MFSFLKKITKNESINKLDSDIDVLTVGDHQYPQAVQQIHNEFWTAGENLLQESLKILDDCAKQDIQKGKRLQSLGFVNTNLAVNATTVESTAQKALTNANLVRYFSMKYPNNKFITEEKVLNICRKYNLIMGTVDRFKGFVPEKNLVDIERFFLKKEDEGISFSNGMFLKGGEIRRSKLTPIYYHVFKMGDITEKDYAFQSDNGKEFYGDDKKNLFGCTDLGFINQAMIEPNGLLICAPAGDMKLLENERINSNRKIEKIPDPVVVKRVEGGYLIVTAWGDEASDEMVINQKLN